MFIPKLYTIAIILFFLPFIADAQNFGGNPSSTKWDQLNSKTVRVIFPRGLDSQANRVNNIIQLLRNTTLNTIGDTNRKWNIILSNQTTIPNAYVRMAPIMSELYLTPGQDNFSNGSLNSIDNLIIHEDRHIQQMSNFNKGFTKLFSFFLGQEGQLLANGITIPDYFFEGDAVWQETLVSAQGRGRMPFFYNGMRSLALDNKKYSWMKLRNGSFRHYTPDHYQLGYQLVAYGYEQYGTDFWRKVTNDAVKFRGVFYAFNNAIKKYSGKTYRQFRENAISYFNERSISSKEKNEAALNYITPIQKNNVIDYLFPNYINDDTVLVTKQSNKEVSAFYLLVNGKEKKIRTKDMTLDDYYSYNKGMITYAAYRSDPRWGNRDYSVIQLVDIYSGKQKQLSSRSKYFSPCLNADNSEVLATGVNTDGSGFLYRISTRSGKVRLKIPNPHNYLFTQTKYIDSNTAISAARDPGGKMALVKVNLTTGETALVTSFSFNVLGYPVIKGDTIYFSMMNGNTDKIFAVTMTDKKIFKLTNNLNGIYHPAINTKGAILFSAFTADGTRLAKQDIEKLNWQEVTTASVSGIQDLYTPIALKEKGTNLLSITPDIKSTVSRYRKSLHLFNFHSWRPVIADPEFGYSLYSDNVLSSFSNSLTYTYNRNEKSSSVGFSGSYAGWFPVISVGTEASFNRIIDTALGKSAQFNTAKLAANISIPLSFVGRRNATFINIGGGYTIEQFLGKSILTNEAFKYTNAFFSFSHLSRQAKQHINPRWGQSLSFNYRDAMKYPRHKLVTGAAFYFPGLFNNHSLVINAAYQKRDSFVDIFSNIFPYSRGYEALSTRRMYKLGVNYHFPLVYPDWGFGNIVFFQRIRANVFYDYTNAKARVNGQLTEVMSRSAGSEIYFDSKIWNALPVSLGVRFSHLLDTDLLNPLARNKWEIIIPIGLIPD